MKKIIAIVIVTFFFVGVSKAQNVGINATGAAPDNSSMLDVASTNSGMLIPRMTQVQRNAIGMPATGLLIYQTNANPGFYYWDGAQWIRLFGGDAWQLDGNAGTNPTNNFLGTTDAQDLVFRTNNVERARFLANGNFGVGVNNPLDLLHVNGIIRLPGSEGNDYQFRAGQNVATGVVVRAITNPANNNPIFAVESSGGATRFGATQGNGVWARDGFWAGIYDNGALTQDVGFTRVGTDFSLVANGTERMRVGPFNGSIGMGRVPCCGIGAGPIVDIYQPLEVGDDAGGNDQALIGYWYGGDVAVITESNGWGFVGNTGQAWWRMYSYGFVNASQREMKKGILPINKNNDVEELVMNDIDKIQPSFYHYNEQNSTPESENDNKYRPHYQLGVIVDESPDYILDEKFKGVDIYSVATLSLAGVKYNRKHIQEIENKIEENLTVNDFGSTAYDGNSVWVSFSKSFTEKLNGQIPVITVTPISSESISIRIVEKNAEGFKVVSDNQNVSSFTFDWIAMAKIAVDSENEENNKTNVDEEIINKMHLNESEKQKVIEHYSNIKLSPKSSKSK